MSYKVTKNFILQEFIDPKIMNRWGSDAVMFMDERMLMLPQFEKEFFSNHFGQEVFVTINDYAWGGHRDESGLRRFDTETGAGMSAHKFGRALDSKYYIKQGDNKVYIKPDTIRAIMTDNTELFMQHGITRLEYGRFAPTWVHRDCVFTGIPTEIVKIKP